MTERPQFDLDRVLELFRALDAQLGDGPPITIHVGGGVAMMTIRRDRFSEDIDIFESRLPEELRAAAAAVGTSEGLPDDWINNAPANRGPDVRQFGTVTLFSGQRLVVRTFDLDGLLATKLLAARPRDEEDTLILMGRTGNTTAAGLRQLLDECFGGQPHLRDDLHWAHLNVEDICEEYERRYPEPGGPSVGW